MRILTKVGFHGGLLCLGGALLTAQTGGVPNPTVDEVVIGFVEDNPAAASGKPGPGLRVALQRQGKDWSLVMKGPSAPSEINQCSIPDIESRRSWTVLDGGRRIGAVTTEGWLDSAFYSHHGLLSVVGSAPQLGKPSALFGGWMGEVRHRPLLAFFGPFLPKPADWKIARVRQSDLKLVWPAFRKAVPQVPRCGADGELVSPQPTTTEHDVEVFKTYVDGHGAKLLGARLKKSRVGTCEGPADRSRSDFWFLAPAKGSAALLEMPDGDDAITLAPLDFLDLDGERSTVAVFWCSGYNHDGYRIYYDGFRKSAEFSWNYH